MYGTLYLIPCPISDRTEPWDVLPAANRAVIDALDYFIVENTRTARRFLSKAGIGRPIDTLCFRELNEHTAAGREVEELVAPLLAGRSAGVISEAGVPGVADPGALVVAACHRRGIRVVPLVGPSSILMALMASGLNGQSFAFNGYLPVKPPERARAIRSLERRAAAEVAALHRGALPQCETLGTAARRMCGGDETRGGGRHHGADRTHCDSYGGGVAQTCGTRSEQAARHFYFRYIICAPKVRKQRYDHRYEEERSLQ